MSHTAQHIALAVVDCTGHGVPGALMSMLGGEILNEISRTDALAQPEVILSALHKGVYRTLKQGQSRNRDGMDVSLCVIDKDQQTLRFAGAKNSLFVVTDSQVRELKGTRRSIGGASPTAAFEQHTLALNDLPPDTWFYMTSDGYLDQFGGTENKKLGKERFKQLLTRVALLPAAQQTAALAEYIETWMTQGHEQPIDDMLVWGFRHSRSTS